MPHRRPLSLKSHLTLLVVGALLPVVLFTGVVLHRLAQSERAVSERRLMRSVRDLASLLDRRHGEYRERPGPGSEPGSRSAFRPQRAKPGRRRRF